MLRMDKTTYISVDVETDGPVPGRNSMLSLGAAAFNRKGELLDKILINFEDLEGAEKDFATMQFWAENPEAYEATKTNRMFPIRGMTEFSRWLRGFENPVFVFMPAKFDGLFVYWYMQTFLNLGFMNTPDEIDVKTLAMVALGEENPHFASKRFWKKAWKDNKTRHNHVAVDDAVEQGIQFIKILNALKQKREDLVNAGNMVM